MFRAMHEVVESYIFEIEDFKNGRSPADCCLWWMDLKIPPAAAGRPGHTLKGVAILLAAPYTFSAILVENVGVGVLDDPHKSP